MNNLDLIRQYTSTGNQIPEHQANSLNPNLLKTYTRAILNMFKTNYDAGFVEEPIEDYNFDLFNDEQKLFYFNLLSDGKLDLNLGPLHQLIKMPDELKAKYYSNSYENNVSEDYRYNLERQYFNLDIKGRIEWLQKTFNNFSYKGYYSLPDIIWNDISDELKLKFFNTVKGQGSHLNMEKFFMLSDDMKMKYSEIIIKNNTDEYLLAHEYRYATEDIKLISDKRAADSIFSYKRSGYIHMSYEERLYNKRQKAFYAELVVNSNDFLDDKYLYDIASDETKWKHYINIFNEFKKYNIPPDLQNKTINSYVEDGYFNRQDYERLKSIYNTQLAELRNVAVSELRKHL
jgi:hypothetical protein